MPPFLKKLIFGFFGFILTILVTTVISILLFKFAFLNVGLNQQMAQQFPLKQAVEQMVVEQTGMTFTLNEPDEKVLKNHLEKWVVDLTLFLNGEKEELNIDPEGELNKIQSELSDPGLKKMIGEAAKDPDLNTVTDPTQTPEMKSLLTQADLISLGMSRYTLILSLLSLFLIFALIAADLKFGLNAVKKSFVHTGIAFALIGILFLILKYQIMTQGLIPQANFAEIFNQYLGRITYISLTFGTVFIVMGVALKQIAKKISTPQI